MGILLLVGIALLAFASGRGKNEKSGTAEAGDLAAYGEALEKRLTAACESVAGVGDARVVITFASGAAYETVGGAELLSVPPRVQGVAVLCEGGADGAVRASLTSMLGALLGIGASRICILPLAA